MEKDLVEKHALELANLKLDDPVEESQQPITGSTTEDGILRKSKAQKRRERKEQEAKQRDIDIQLAEEDNKTSSRQIESKAFNKMLKSRNLTLYHIKSDGDCLYNAIRHQLELAGQFYTVEELRKIAASYIRANKDELIFYMPSATGEMMSNHEFDEYCNQVENTKAWGSQVEIQALSNSLKVKVEILQAEGNHFFHASFVDFVSQ
jgi:OTU domain-containing protein 6